jgi:hypothetical protein
MRKRSFAGMAYVGAALTLVIAICVPFYLFGAFTNVVAHAGLHVDATYSGGTVARTMERNGYQIDVYQPVWPRALQRVEPFVQIVFKPADALPPQVSEEIDLDGDGQPDVRVSFVVPADPHAPLRGDVRALNSKYQSLANVGGDSYSRLVVRVDNQVIVRVPLSEVSGGR